jgi:hypothetical protein
VSDLVLVTQSELAKAERVFGRQSDLQVIAGPEDEASLAETVHSKGCRAVIVGVQPYSGELYEAQSKPTRPWRGHRWPMSPASYRDEPRI